MDDLLWDLPHVSNWVFSQGSYLDNLTGGDVPIAFSVDYVDNDVAEYARKLERALPYVEDSIGPCADATAPHQIHDEDLVRAQMLAYKKADDVLPYLESYPSSGMALPPFLAAFAVELYRYHMPEINMKLSRHAKTRYELLESFVWGLLSDNDELRQEVVRKWLTVA